MSGSDANERPGVPVVLVHGLFGWGPGEMLTQSGPLGYWETAVEPETDTSGLTVLEASMGPISSQHDRACELYAQIRGRRTDYGEGHSAVCGHDRWGPDFTGAGLYPDWGPARPVHLIGHSAGGNTARTLQHLLGSDFWSEGTGADWIRSISCIGAPLNGSTAAYLFGCQSATGRFTWQQSVARLLLLLSDAGSKRWKLSHWGVGEADYASRQLLAARLADTQMLSGIDHLAFDLTVQGCAGPNAMLLPDCPRTYYMSYVTKCTTVGLGGSVVPWMCNRVLLASCAYICSRTFSGLPAAYDPADSDWRHNDGLVSVASQRYPLLGDRLVAGKISDIADESQLRPGRWYYDYVGKLMGTPSLMWDHTDVMVFRGVLWERWLGSFGFMRGLLAVSGRLGRLLGRAVSNEVVAKVTKQQQREFYQQLYRRLSRLR